MSALVVTTSGIGALIAAVGFFLRPSSSRGSATCRSRHEAAHTPQSKPDSALPKAPSTPERVSWAIEQLALSPDDHVLEIGCGGGHAVTLLCERLTRGGVMAIDRSAIQTERARARNARWIAAGRARIETLALVEAPGVLGRGRFDRALAINVNAFWTDPAANLNALHELLAPLGRAYLVFEPPSANRLREARDTLPGLVSSAGLKVVDIRTATFRRSRGLCIIGERTATTGRRA